MSCLFSLRGSGPRCVALLGPEGYYHAITHTGFDFKRYYLVNVYWLNTKMPIPGPCRQNPPHPRMAQYWAQTQLSEKLPLLSRNKGQNRRLGALHYHAMAAQGQHVLAPVLVFGLPYSVNSTPPTTSSITTSAAFARLLQHMLFSSLVFSCLALWVANDTDTVQTCARTDYVIGEGKNRLGPSKIQTGSPLLDSPTRHAKVRFVPASARQ